MFESLKKAIDEIFGSVIRPIKEWILRQSWGVRVVCLIVIAVAAFQNIAATVAKKLVCAAVALDDVIFHTAADVFD